MIISELIKKLEEKSGMTPLAFSDEGVISFIFNGEFTANLEKSVDEQYLTVYGKIGQLPLKNRESYMFQLLSANLFNKETKGASIGLEPDTESIYLFKTFTLSTTSFDQFYDELTQFLKTEQDWTNKLKYLNG